MLRVGGHDRLELLVQPAPAEGFVWAGHVDPNAAYHDVLAFFSGLHGPINGDITLLLVARRVFGELGCSRSSAAFRGGSIAMTPSP